MSFDPLYLASGDLRSRIQIQTHSTTQDPFGQPTDTWTTVLTTRARIRTLTLREQYGQTGFSGQATHQVTMRYQSSVPIVSGQRIAHGAKTFLVQSVENVLERNRVINALVLELQPTQ